MSKITFTAEQVAALQANPYVKAASHKSIAYTDEFKRHVVFESLQGKYARQIFQEAGFAAEVLANSASGPSPRNGGVGTVKKVPFPWRIPVDIVLADLGKRSGHQSRRSRD